MSKLFPYRPFGSHAYSAAKAAVIQLTRTVAAELTDSGVQVNCICPGDIGVSMPGQVSKAAGVAEPPASQAEAGLKRMPRAGLAQGVAQAAVWLASDAAGSATGHALVVDGGLSNGRCGSRPDKGG